MTIEHFTNEDEGVFITSYLDQAGRRFASVTVRPGVHNLGPAERRVQITVENGKLTTGEEKDKKVWTRACVFESLIFEKGQDISFESVGVSTFSCRYDQPT